MIFRYPGGKSRVASTLVDIMAPDIEETGKFLDAFVGGGSVTLAVAERYPDVELWVNDKDPNISAFWKVIAGEGDILKLVALLEQEPTVSLFRKLRETEPKSLEERAYYGVFFNRTTFSGISTSGPIGGYEQKDKHGNPTKWPINCRYNVGKLIRDTTDLREQLSDKLTATSMDIQQVLDESDGWAIYLDPPYFEKGGELYSEQFSVPEHLLLAGKLHGLDKWTLSYDDNVNIRNAYEGIGKIAHGEDVRYSINGEKVKWRSAAELIIRPLENT